jgi:hypothetical protein
LLSNELNQFELKLEKEEQNKESQDEKFLLIQEVERTKNNNDNQNNQLLEDLKKIKLEVNKSAEYHEKEIESSILENNK